MKATNEATLAAPTSPTLESPGIRWKAPAISHLLFWDSSSELRTTKSPAVPSIDPWPGTAPAFDATAPADQAEEALASLHELF